MAEPAKVMEGHGFQGGWAMSCGSVKWDKELKRRGIIAGFRFPGEWKDSGAKAEYTRIEP